MAVYTCECGKVSTGPRCEDCAFRIAQLAAQLVSGALATGKQADENTLPVFVSCAVHLMELSRKHGLS